MITSKAGYHLSTEEFQGLRGTDAYVRMLCHRLRVRPDPGRGDVPPQALWDHAEQVMQCVDRVATSIFHCEVDHIRTEVIVYLGNSTDQDLAMQALKKFFSA